MSWATAAALISRYRHAATLAIAGSVALISTLSTQHGAVRLGLSSATKLFAFVFCVALVVVAVLMTVLLVIAETKVEAAKRALEPEFPVAIAKQVTPTAPSPLPRPIAPPKEPERDLSDGPSVLR